MNKLKRKIKLAKKQALVCLVLGCLLIVAAGSVQIARADWQEPTAAPPGNNIPAPIGKTGESQTKEGRLRLDPNYNPDNPPFSIDYPLEVVGDGGKFITGTADSMSVADTLYVDKDSHQVGIGTASPTAQLSVVNGTVMIGTSTQPIEGQAVAAFSSDNYAISGTTMASNDAGIYGLSSNTDGYGVLGTSGSNYGIYGQSTSGYGIYGMNNSTSSAAVYGENTSASSIGWAGYFDGMLGAGGDVVSGRFLPTNLQTSLVPFTAGQEVGSYSIGTWTNFPDTVRLAFDGTYVWAVTNDRDDANHNLFKVRASDGVVVDAFTVGTSNHQAAAFDGTYIWIVSTSSEEVFRFDPRNGSYEWLDSSVSGFSPTPKQSLAVSSIDGIAYVWTSDPLAGVGGEIIKINSSTLSFETFDFNGITGLTDPAELAFDGMYLWVTAQDSVLPEGRIVRLLAADPTSDPLVVDTFVLGCDPYNIYADGEYVWCLQDTAGQLLRIWAEDPDDLRHPIKSYGAFEAGNRDMVFDGTYLWVVNYTNSKLYRYLASDPAASYTDFSLSFQPKHIVFDGTYLWITQADGGSDPILHKFYSGTSLGHTDLNTVVNLRTRVGQCENPDDPPTSSGLQCVFNWHCPVGGSGAGNAPPPPGGISRGTNRAAVAKDTAIDSTYMYTVGRSMWDWYIEKRSLADSSLDTSFGSDGVIAGPSESYEAQAIAIDSTYMYVVGNDSNPDFRIEKRFLSDGSYDTSFGTNGVALGTSSSATAMDIAIDSTYMYVVGGTEQGRVRIEKRLLSDGSYVSGFGGAGSDPEGVLTGSSGSGNLTAIAIDSTFMYIIGGDSVGDWRIEKRYLSDGSYDTTFGTSGVEIGASESNVAHDIAIDLTFMYIVGADHSLDWRIEKRYLSDGSLDTTFGVSGVVTGEAGSSIAHALSIDSTYMYVVGDGSPWRIGKYALSDGTPDSGFVDEGSSYTAFDIAIDLSYMYIVGTGNFRTEKRSLSDGALDINFGPGELDVYGLITGASESGTAYDVAIDATYMYVVGNTDSPYNWRLEKRLLSSGALDSGFGTNGVVTSTAGGRYIYGIAIDATYMYVVGSTDSPYNWYIEKRFLSDGSYDTSFGTGGVITGPSESSLAYDIAVDSTYMYVVGRTDGGDWYIEKRFLSDGSYDTSFGTGGVITGPSESFIAEGIAIDATYMYVVGYTLDDDTRIEKRFLSDGSYDTSFGTGGVIIGPSESKNAYSIAIDATYMYVVGYGSPWRIEKYALSDGTHDSGFGTSGVVEGSGFTAFDIAIDSTYMYVVGDLYIPSTYFWNIEKRFLTDGSLAAGFGGVRLDPEGVISGDIISNRAYGIAIDSEAMYVVGNDQTPGDWRIEKRGLTAGALFVDSFGDYTYGSTTSDEVCNTNNAVQKGNINIINSAEIMNNHCYSPGLDEHYFNSPCTSDTDCSGGQQCAGGDLQVDGDIDVSGNTWQVGTEQIVDVAGDPKTAVCPAGTFIKGINIVAGKLDNGSIICQGL